MNLLYEKFFFILFTLFIYYYIYLHYYFFLYYYNFLTILIFSLEKTDNCKFLKIDLKIFIKTKTAIYKKFYVYEYLKK